MAAVTKRVTVTKKQQH